MPKHAQVNIKLDPKLKKQLEELARKLGFSLTSITRAFYLQFLRTQKIDFSVAEYNPKLDTDTNMTGKDLEKALIEEGEDPKRAKRHGEAYDRMLKAERAGRLIEL